MDLSPDEEQFQGRLLHQAALWDNLELLQELVSTGAEVNGLDEHGRTALHGAALAERSRCLKALCENGVDIDVRSDAHTGEKTALHIAAERGHAENVRSLLTYGADAAVTDAAGDTALALAERHAHRHAAAALRDNAHAMERERLSAHAQLRELLQRGDVAQLKVALQSLGQTARAGLIVNLTPGGANTLLYVACETGLTGAVSALIAAGADGRAHPVTKYGPLYVAAYHGYIEIAKLLLQHFPQAGQQETVEKWLPLHAACIGGHAALVTLLLEYPYPSNMLNTYTDASGRRYSAAFDVNATDLRGQTALHVACTLGNLKVVNALLEHTREVESATPPEIPSPHRSGISLGIHAIVTKLTGGANRPASPTLARPVRTESSARGDSSLAAAARAGHVAVVRRLLQAGAAACAAAAPPQTQNANTESDRDRRRSRSACSDMRSASPTRNYHNEREAPWTALAAACRNKHVAIGAMLLQHGATDPHGRALHECAAHGFTDLVAAILATKAYPDPEYRLNKPVISEAVFKSRSRVGPTSTDSALTFAALCPHTPVAVNWRELKARLPEIRMSWLVSAARAVNPRVSGGAAALLALTRIDISNNELRRLPTELFTLQSLRYLNAAGNKLEGLPCPRDPPAGDGGGSSWRRKPARPPLLYTAPALQELYLQDNRLEELPPALFLLPSLSTLDVSNNKLRQLPPQLWAAPALRDLNAQLNHLKDLPPPDTEAEARTPDGVKSPKSTPTSPTTPMSISSSRSPSIEHSESTSEEDAIPTVGNRAGNAVLSTPLRAHSWRGCVAPSPPPPGAGRRGSPLASLNLAHNQLACVPIVLACAAPMLTRLNLAYNCLRSMSHVTSYPTSLRQLDLSHNEITCWMSLPQVAATPSSPLAPLPCYCPTRDGATPRGARARPSPREHVLNAACVARRHLRLDSLRTLIVSNNLLTRIQLTTDDDGTVVIPTNDERNDDDDEWGAGSRVQARLVFPQLSMLDASCNLLHAVPPTLHHLTNLSVLNLSGNKDITELPPQMGLLSRLWSLSATGCSLSEPLRSMLAGTKYKSADVIGYLKSVLHAATTYTRMRLMLVGQQGIGKTSLLECLRQESSIQHRRKSTDHWARRMGNKSSRRNMSTVGVDIGLWTYEKTRSNRGPVTFRTWDFGGQQEYYATHQYFLSRRSLYLVVWKVTDGKKGLEPALHWLRSIQARAPGSPVIMVGTHYDQVAYSNLPESESPEALQRLIRSSIMGAGDADKLGLPRVMDSLEVSCSSRHNIRLLADIIYSVAFSVKPPGSKEPLLEQRIPASYLMLEECVTSLAADLPEPVLRHAEYKQMVQQYMQAKNVKMFRDGAELHQATMFLHENGVLLHYDDANLKELYFVRPQWLCDVLAHVITVREINPFVHNGIMKVEDLPHVFKASPLLGRGELGLSLLHKFELALCWDGRSLLLPPLLPQDEGLHPQLPIRGRSWCGGRRAWPSAPLAHPALPTALPAHPTALPAGVNAMLDYRRTDSPTLIQDSSSIIISGRAGGSGALQRTLALTYVPVGFWARLMARLLADTQLAQQPHLLYTRDDMEFEESVSQALESAWGWKVSRRGISLVCGTLTVASLKEVPPKQDPLLASADDGDTRRIRVRQEDSWCDLELSSSACIELVLPGEVCVIRREDGAPCNGYQSISLEPRPEVLARMLAIMSDHLDLLLEDWYPALGTRFVHTSEGRCLITRIIMCPACLRDTYDPPDRDQHIAQQAMKRLELAPVVRPRVSEESGDSGVGHESNASSRLGSVEGVGDGWGPPLPHGWTVEHCLLAASTGARLACPTHGATEPRDVAPDLLLLDVEESRRARWEDITPRAVLGRGAFGTVMVATWRAPGRPALDVALKLLQPVAPPKGADLMAVQAYKAGLARWEREPAGAACRAYCALRGELQVLRALKHAHVVPWVAAVPAPRALLLHAAPGGALDGVLKQYLSCGARVGVRAARALLLQVARALEYLHAARVVYRDLKAENVLVWSMPTAANAAAAERSTQPVDVLVKLGDYGISRLAPPSGTKGFGGTEGFMAPEIMRYNGEEEYNEKVDCFSFGMLIYEVISCRQPFDGHEAVKEAILDGARPPLSPRELEYPVNILETLRRCWSGQPSSRPSAGALVSALAAPELAALCDAAAARPVHAAAAVVVHVPDADSTGWEVWYGGGEPERVHTLVAVNSHLTQHYTLRIPPDASNPVVVTAICVVGAHAWVGDSAGRVHVYDISTCVVSWSVSIEECVGSVASGIAALSPLPKLQRVALALDCGRLFLVSVSRPSPGGSFVLTELGTSTSLACLAHTVTDVGISVWAGGADLCAYIVNEEGVASADTVPLPEHGGDCGNEISRVTLLTASDDQPYIYGYIEPGVVVYQWSAAPPALTARLDCSKLVPCSECLDPGAEDHVLEARVSSICACRGAVLVGTAAGCVLLADTALRPLAVCRPYETQVQMIVALNPRNDEEDPMVATFGAGYRPLLQRYAPLPNNNNLQQQLDGNYCLLWRAQHWLPD